ncbi:MAG: type II-A CRISPR-associated protein Csn2 [Clostridia bacterium]|nr:type II-A CRISPR-associated protein Csn2 [Clostridia bacterium]
MKIIFPPLTSPIKLSDEYATTIVVENKKCFYEIVTDLYNQVNKSDGRIVLSKSDKVIDIVKNVELISQYVPFDCNKKVLLTKLHQKLKDVANNSFYCETTEILSILQKYIFDIADTYNSELEIDEIDLTGLFKLFNVRFSNDLSSLSASIYSYCTNVVSLEGDKLFIFVGLRTYIDDDDYLLLLRTLIDHKIRVLFLETSCFPDNEYEQRIIIDKDLCVI